MLALQGQASALNLEHSAVPTLIGRTCAFDKSPMALLVQSQSSVALVASPSVPMTAGAHTLDSLREAKGPSAQL